MKLYTCKLRLAGAVTNEVQKTDVTAAEIEIFRHLHGEDAVLDVKASRDVKRTSGEERTRLRDMYANPERLNSHQLKLKTEMLRNLFGHDRMPLPDDIEEVAAAEDADDEKVTEAAPEAPARRTRVPKPPAETFAE